VPIVWSGTKGANVGEGREAGATKGRADVCRRKYVGVVIDGGLECVGQY